mmetsp:Transcript_6003/g.17925  ORF Transcript_6003/g.17925 Transcript_6003/m.17925 type:complete len:228 (-) Transcript_6003:36-719(-)
MSFSSPMPVPIGEITGVMPMSNKELRSSVLTVSTSPTNPRSYPSLLIFLTHCSSESSRPDRPSARPPALQIVDAISLLTEPQSTISATSTTSGDETRMPPSNRLSTPTFSSMALICGPPPCTTTTRMPRFCSVATSSQKPALSSGDVMALPPYLTTTVLPLRDAAASEMVLAASENESASSAAKSDERRAVVAVNDGAKAADAPIREETRINDSFMTVRVDACGCAS